jgi:peptidoglycan/LPS O-acetylase OafA/YrhL
LDLYSGAAIAREATGRPEFRFPMVRHFKTLDAMRGIAALAVLSLHISRLFGFGYQPSSAHLAVDFFFMLSGFVIARAYGAKLAAGWSIRAFFARRAVRLYPMILVGATLGFAVLVAAKLALGGTTWLSIGLVVVPNLVLSPSPALLALRPFGFLINSPYWSLSCEMVVNLAYAAIAARLTTARLIALLGLSAIALIALSFLKGGLDVGVNWADSGLGLVRATFPFIAGVTIQRFVKLRMTEGMLNLPAVAILAALLFSPFSAAGRFEALLVIIAFPVLLIAGASAVPTRTLEPIWRGLGEISYPLYAVHYPIVVALAQLSRTAHLKGTAQLALAATTAAVALLIAYAALVLFDRPVRAWLQRRTTADRDHLLAPAANKLVSV